MVLGYDTPHKVLEEPAQINNVVSEQPKQLADIALPQLQEKGQIVLADAPTVQTPAIGDHSALMAAAGINVGDYSYVEYIIAHESSWNATAHNPSGAYGVCQALPAQKMESAGSDYMTNIITQLRWCDSYAKSRYRGWSQSYQHWISARWW